MWLSKTTKNHFTKNVLTNLLCFYQNHTSYIIVNFGSFHQKPNEIGHWKRTKKIIVYGTKLYFKQANVEQIINNGGSTSIDNLLET